MLGLPFTEAIDVWSLGCMTADLFLGYPLYPGLCEYDMIRYIVDTHGQIPNRLLRHGTKTRRYFCWNTATNSAKDAKATNVPLWRLKTPVEIYQETWIQSTETRMLRFSSLDELKLFNITGHLKVADNIAEFHDQQKFVDVLKKMLQLDPHRRITPSQLLQHPFFSMSHLVDMYSHSSHVQSCFQMMDICQRQKLTSDSGKGASQSTHQPSLQQKKEKKASSSTTHPAQHSNPFQVHPAGLSSLAQPSHQRTNPHPSSTTKRKQSTPPGNSVVAPPISTDQPGSHQMSNRGRTQVRSERKRERVEVERESVEVERMSVDGKRKSAEVEPRESHKRDRGSDETCPGNKSKRSRFGREDRHRVSPPRVSPPTSSATQAVPTSDPPNPVVINGKGETNRKDEGGVRLDKPKRSAGSLASHTSKRTANQTDASHSASDAAQPEAKRSRVCPSTEDFRARARTQNEASTSTSQAGMPSSLVHKWYSDFVPELLPVLYPAGPDSGRAKPGTEPPPPGPSKQPGPQL